MLKTNDALRTELEELVRANLDKLNPLRPDSAHARGGAGGDPA